MLALLYDNTLRSFYCKPIGEYYSHTFLYIPRAWYQTFGLHARRAHGLKIYVPCKNFHVPIQYLYKPFEACVYCWENKYMPRMKSHLPNQAHNHKSSCALGQNHVGMPWSGLGRVPDLRVRVQVRVLVICVSTSTSTWLLHEYEYWLMSTSTSTSTGLWSTSYISSSIAFFSLWQGNTLIIINLGQSSNCPSSM